jgi:AcrR family transcriptional regulator
MRYMKNGASPRRSEILEGIVDYIFERGVSDLSLRPLAEYLGTSARMLVYNFKSRDQMLAEALAAARARQYAMLGDWVTEGASVPELVRRYWAWAASDTARPYIRFFFEVFGLAVQGRPGTEEVLPAISCEAEALFLSALGDSALPPERARELVRLAIAVIRGLLFDLLATNDRPPLDAALERFTRFLEAELVNQ